VPLLRLLSFSQGLHKEVYETFVLRFAMKIDPQRLQLASALDSDDSDSREEGEIRSVDLPPPSSPPRDPRHAAFYKLQDELRLGLPRFAHALHWANTLKETGGGTRYPVPGAPPAHITRPSSSSATPLRTTPRHASRERRGSSFLRKSPPRRSVSRRRESRSRSPPTSRNVQREKRTKRATKHRISRSPSPKVSHKSDNVTVNWFSLIFYIFR
jgi:hypothetical protein